ncbi:hypothetical protein F0562_009158 [Nyssa sinensis]|uniref:Uncharacterized protein n=1 Tax=Nyssa sinensis TaxID=561372 RepID=A0A5J4ZWE1_9ASTE|nr:hypothetical protein F0562_009158 [Nyssa sinensis]
MSTYVALDRLQILKLFLIMSATISINTRYSLGNLQLSRLLQTLSGYCRTITRTCYKPGLIVGGWDKHEGGKIYGVPLGGTILEQPFAIGGSGSTYLYGFFDQEWKEGMTKDEAEQFVVKAVSLAIARDGASGGVVRTVTINSEGVTRNFYPGDTLPLWHEELEPQNSLLDILSLSSPEPMPRRTHFAIEVVSLKPSFGSKLNQDGFSPMHLALQNGRYDTVKQLARIDSDLVGVQGKERKTPLHFVTETGNLDLLAGFLLACPTSIEKLTIRYETAVHIAVKNKKLEALKMLLGWLYWTDVKEEVLERMDEDGNTVLQKLINPRHAYIAY